MTASGDPGFQFGWAKYKKGTMLGWAQEGLFPSPSGGPGVLCLENFLKLQPKWCEFSISETI